jgi:hypothetical protein
MNKTGEKRNHEFTRNNTKNQFRFVINSFLRALRVLCGKMFSVV